MRLSFERVCLLAAAVIALAWLLVFGGALR
jgi:hypothetical protein